MSAPHRPASTVVLLRDAAGGPEVFMVRRHDRSAFMGGASVFPGGRVEDTDAAGVSEMLAHRIAAIRELFEEAGVLLARSADGGLIAADDEPARARLMALRHDLHEGRATLQSLAEAAHVQLALDALTPFARWRTPPIDVRQFDAWFFLARMPPDQHPEADQAETTLGAWLRPSLALARARAGDITLPPPTWTTLRELEPFSSVDAAVRWAAERVVVARQPQVLDRDGSRFLLLPGDPLNSESWHEPPPQETRFRLADGRWIAERAVS